MLSDLLAVAMREIEKYEQLSPDTQPVRASEIKKKMVGPPADATAEAFNRRPPPVRRIAAEEVLRNQLGNLIEAITKPEKLAASLPEGDTRNQLYDRISELYVIADGIRRALDSLI